MAIKSQLAVQMYTVRDFTKSAADLKSTLERLTKIGYTAVQMSAVGAMGGDSPEVSPKTARSMLDDLGLKCIATHRSWDTLAKETSKEIDFHHALGCDFTAIGSLPGDYGSRGAQGYRDFLTDSAPVIAQLKAAGIRFGYHNHAHELERFEFSQGMPRTCFDIFIDDGGPDFCMELDLYWLTHAGANPERIVERCVGQLPVIHVKDKEVANGQPVMAPVGEGNLDWTNLIPACERAGVEWYAVEQDECRRDPFDCLRSSCEFLSRF